LFEGRRGLHGPPAHFFVFSPRSLRTTSAGTLGHPHRTGLGQGHPSLQLESSSRNDDSRSGVTDSSFFRSHDVIANGARNSGVPLAARAAEALGRSPHRSRPLGAVLSAQPPTARPNPLSEFRLFSLLSAPLRRQMCKRRSKCARGCPSAMLISRHVAPDGKCWAGELPGAKFYAELTSSNSPDPCTNRGKSGSNSKGTERSAAIQSAASQGFRRGSGRTPGRLEGPLSCRPIPGWTRYERRIVAWRLPAKRVPADPALSNHSTSVQVWRGSSVTVSI